MQVPAETGCVLILVEKFAPLFMTLPSIDFDKSVLTSKNLIAKKRKIPYVCSLNFEAEKNRAIFSDISSLATEKEGRF